MIRPNEIDNAGKMDVFMKEDNGFVKTFPQKLMEVLSCDEANQYIAWVPKGDAFMILDESSFVNFFLSRFFVKKTTFHSFKGKLYRWGFKRFRKSGAFYHKFFHRYHPALCIHIRRVGKDIPKTAEIVSPTRNTRKSLKLTGSKSKLNSDNPKFLDGFATNRYSIPTIPMLQTSMLSPVSPIASQASIQSLVGKSQTRSISPLRHPKGDVGKMNPESIAKIKIHTVSPTNVFSSHRYISDINSSVNYELLFNFSHAQKKSCPNSDEPFMTALDGLISLRSQSF